MKIVKIRNQSNPETTLQVKYCDSFLCKFLGLMFRKAIGRNEGIVLVEKSESRFSTSIHMLFMAFDIAVFWLDKDCIVVDKVLAKMWRPFYMSKYPAKFVLELHHSKISKISVGDQLFINSSG